MDEKEVKVNVTVRIVGLSTIMWLLLVMTAFAFGYALASMMNWIDMLRWGAPACCLTRTVVQRFSALP